MAATRSAQAASAELASSTCWPEKLPQSNDAARQSEDSFSMLSSLGSTLRWRMASARPETTSVM
ncbi:MAG TPA: hypothetical protein VGV93_00785 [Acidimicrobiales bacterium]|nr:hypothetical protein [Acidimicrobiales bacterium]